MKFRLSTALIMVLVAAVLLGLNLRERPQEYGYIQSIDYDGASIARGFPTTGCYQVRIPLTEVLPGVIVQPRSIFAWYLPNVGLDIIFFIAMVLGIGVIVERFVFKKHQ